MNRRPLSADQLQEVEDLVALAELDAITAQALMLELVELRRLHHTALHRRGRLSIELDRLPHQVGDVAAWKELIHRSREALPYTDAPDLVALATKP